MRQLVAHTFSALAEHGEAIALLNDENLHKGRHLRRSKRIRALYDPLVDTIREVLRRGADQGIFRRDIDPVTLSLTLSSLAYHYLSRSIHAESPPSASTSPLRRGARPGSRTSPT